MNQEYNKLIQGYFDSKQNAIFANSVVIDTADKNDQNSIFGTYNFKSLF